jgi:hypothetical protein
MSTTSKSPRRVLLVAHAAAREALPAYAHRFAPKKYTQPQLLAILVLKAHQKKDYRGVCALLAESPHLCAAIDLQAVPHWTTLHKACARLLRCAAVRKLLEETLALSVQRRQPARRIKHAAADSTGLDTHHASRYFIWRSGRNPAGKQPKQRVSYQRFGKLMLLTCCASHLILAAVASAGPTPDVGELSGLMAQLPRNLVIERAVADAGFDSAHNHRLLREDHGIMSIIPAQHGRPAKDGKLPADKYRRRMKTHFNTKAYRKRAQVETVMSMLKRNLGDCLRGQTYHSRRRDMLLMCITHNMAIVLLVLI